ncbi:MAG: ATP-binding protein [Chloroherpetonaceae bacterium]|nr:ATP-binding protein [Chloroherpetonaceae bacterium]MDW8437756.1 ATP-binding protein [Chloroherpetonaceae bacterium]
MTNDFAKLRRAATTILLLFLLAVCAAGVSLTAARLNWDERTLAKTDAVVSVKGVPIRSKAHLSFLLRRLERSEPLDVVVERPRERITYAVSFKGDEQIVSPVAIQDTVVVSLLAGVERCFGAFRIVGVLVACLIAFACAFFAHRKSSDDDASFSLAVALIGVMIASGQARFSETPHSLAAGVHFAFLAAFAFSPALFLRWSLRFPKPAFSSTTATNVLFWTLLALGATMVFVSFHRFQQALAKPTGETFRAYSVSLNVIRAFFALLVLTSFLILVRRYAQSEAEHDRRRLRWVIVGATLSALPFIFFSLLPNALIDRAFLPDAVAVALAILAASMMTVAATRYRLLAVEALFNRSFVFFGALLLLSLLYGATLFLLSQIFSSSESFSPYIAAGLATLITLILFEPTTTLVKRFAESRVFKAEFSAQEAERILSAEIQGAKSEKDLVTKVAKKLRECLPVTSVAVALRSDDKKLKLAAGVNFNDGGQSSISPPPLLSDSRLIAHSEQIEDGVEHQPLDEAEFRPWNPALVVPITSEPRGKTSVLGCLLLGEKTSRLAFSAEEARWLQSIAGQTALMLLRLREQRKLVLKDEENKRLRELAEIRFRFVNAVSHDLRTPLASIKSLADLLSKNIGDETAKQHTERIARASNRLSKMVENILNYAKLEKGEISYRFEPLNLSDLAQEVVKSMDCQLELGGFEVKQSFAEEPLPIQADKNLLPQAMWNLVSNALKYSGESKTIEVSTRKDGDCAVFSVKDYGIGISSEDIDKIFKPFFRSSNAEAQVPSGFGLGLWIVKQVVEIHEGEVRVRSELGKGSEFELRLPLMNGVEKPASNAPRRTKAGKSE